MWDFEKLAPDKLLAISKTLTGASFGFGLSKVLPSFGFALRNLLLNYTCQTTSALHLYHPNHLTQQPHIRTQDACERQYGRRVCSPCPLS